MDDREFLKKFIKDFRGKMNLSLLLEWCVIAAGVGAFVALLAELTVLLTPFYHAHLIAVLCVALGLLCGAVIAGRKWYSEEEAALAIDRFGFEERVITAYENLEREDRLLVLQRSNAVLLLDANKEMVRQKIMPSWKKLLVTMLICIMAAVAAMIPSQNREIAMQRHELLKQAEEKQEEIKEALEALEGIETEELTEDQQAQIEAMKESLNASMEEMREISSNHFMNPEELVASSNAMQQANERLDYKFENMADQLGQMAEQTEAREISGQDQSTSQSLRNAADQIAGNDKQNNGQNGSNPQTGQNAGQNGSQSSNSMQAGQNGSQSSNSMQAGQNGSQSGNSAQTGQNGNSAQANNGQNGTGGEGQNGQAGGGQTGAEGGEQAGQGSQAGQGGSEAGTGTASNQHDYVSVPNALGNDESLHGNSTESEESEYYREQNGLAWEGEHVNYESVIGEYTNQAYEGLEQGRYPSGMTDVIKDYFGNLQ